MFFRDREEAGSRLARRLLGEAESDPVVLALPRGGLPVADRVSQALSAPLDVILVHKLGVPWNPELALGAIGEGNVRVLDAEMVAAAGVTSGEIGEIVARAEVEVEHRARRYRRDRDPIDLAGRSVIVVDDGIATGSTARAACLSARGRGASRVVLAAPVAPRQVLATLASAADEVICLATPEPFYAVGQFYDDFTAISEDEVVRILAGAAARRAGEG